MVCPCGVPCVCAVSAGAYSFKSNGIYYTITSTNPATVEVAEPDSEANRYSGTINVPASVTNNGTTYRVTGIGHNAFYYCLNLNRVTLPNSLTYINNYAFYQCGQLESVTIPSGVTRIGAYAFALCEGSGFTTMLVPDACTFINLGAFYGCKKLTSVTLGSSVNDMRDLIFKGCTSLTSVTCKAATPPSMYSSTFDQSHYDNVTLKVLYSSLSAYQDDSYWGQFNNTQRLNYDFYYNSIYYRIYNADERTVDVAYDTSNSYTGSINIPNSVSHNGVIYTVKRIASHAFDYCTGMYAISLPYELEYIGTYAFRGCTSLRTISIPDKVWYLGSWSFMNCSNLESVTIGTDIRSMGDLVFKGCSSLTNIRCKAYTPPAIMSGTLSDQYSIATLTVPYMSLSAYRNADYWRNFTTIKDAANDFNAMFLYFIRTSDNTVAVTYRDENYNSYSGNVTIPDQITYEGVTYNVTSIRQSAFRDCTGLTSIRFPQSSLQEIGIQAFFNCTSLTKVDIPNSVGLVGGMAFYNCSSLGYVIHGENISFYNQHNVFMRCDNLRYVDCFAKRPPVINEDIFPEAAYNNAMLSVPSESLDAYAAADNWKKFMYIYTTYYDFVVNGIYYKKSVDNTVGVAHKDLNYDTYRGNINVPATVEYDGITYDVVQICNNAFAECPNLTSVTLPNSITFIHYNAFR